MPPGVWDSSLEGGTAEENRGQALHNHPFYVTGTLWAHPYGWPGYPVPCPT